MLLLVLGTDFAILWGLLAIVLSYIPYIGLVTAAIQPALLTWPEFGLLRALIVVVGVTAINIIVEDLVSPAMMSRSMSLAPVVSPKYAHLAKRGQRSTRANSACLAGGPDRRS